MARPNLAEIDLSALRHNLAHARHLAPDSKVMAVVKANAYGHGAINIAGALEDSSDALAVACIEEADELRAGGITLPILLLEGVFEACEIDRAAEQNYWLMIENEWQLSALENASPVNPLSCWLKVDTGMHRLGIAPDLTESCYNRLKASANANDDIVLCTHFASADDLLSNQTIIQIEQFEQVCDGLPAPRSSANSPGLLAWPDARQDWVRPGYMLYGNSPFGMQAHPNTVALQPVMTLRSAIISIREVQPGESVGYAASWTAQRASRIATICIGYGDGYPRLAKNGTPVLINGKRSPLAGRVSMDMITVDVTDNPEATVGDDVILWGKDLPVAEVAEWAETIGYELTTRMPARVPRVIKA